MVIFASKRLGTYTIRQYQKRARVELLLRKVDFKTKIMT